MATAPSALAEDDDNLFEFVVGFVFDGPKDFVGLIKKTRPDWQVGKLNGLGGKIKHGESPEQAMAREAEEEAGVSPLLDWYRYHTLHTETAVVHFFVAHKNVKLVTRTDEEVAWYNLAGVYDELPVIPNLRWLIPMALYALTRYAKGLPFFSTSNEGPDE